MTEEIEVEVIFGDLWEHSKTERDRIPFSRLTRLAARETLEHYGRDRLSHDGAVWWPEGGYGYRVYRYSMRKLHRRWRDLPAKAGK